MNALHLVEGEGASVKQSAGRAAFTMQEVADLLNVSYQSVRKMVREGELRSVSIGTNKRIPAVVLDEFLAGEQ